MSETASLAAFRRPLQDLRRWLESEGVAGAVMGGVAVSLLGRPRTTRDVDTLVWVDEPRLEVFLRAGEQFGFLPRSRDPLGNARRHRVLLMRHQPSGVEVDLVLGGLPFEREVLAAARSVRDGDVEVRVVAPDHLIIMKAVAHRPQDLVDIETVLDAHPDVDRRQIRWWVREFAVAMESPEILKDLNKILARHRPPRKRKRRKRR